MEPDSLEGRGVAELSLRKHDMASVYYAKLSPCLSRHFMEHCNGIKRKLSVKATSAQLCCQSCSTLFDPENHRVRFKSKMQNKSMDKILKKVNSKGVSSLRKFEKHMHDLYTKKSSQTVISCFVCNRKTKLEWVGTAKRNKINKGQEMKEDLHKTYKEKRKEKKRQKRRAGLGVEQTEAPQSQLKDNRAEKLPGMLCNQTSKLDVKHHHHVGLSMPGHIPGLNSKLDKKGKSKKGQNVLQTMLAKAKKEKQKEGNGSLNYFLSDL